MALQHREHPADDLGKYGKIQCDFNKEKKQPYTGMQGVQSAEYGNSTQPCNRKQRLFLLLVRRAERHFAQQAE